jgi:DNA modification methylase
MTELLDKEWIFDLANHFDCDEQIWWGGDWYRRTLPAGGSWYVWDKQISEHDGKSHTGSLFELAWSKTPHKREIIKSPYFRFYGMDTKQRLHPTQKPVKLCSWFINELSKENWNIIDLFGGSGSTLIACEQLNRKCFMMEISPVYIDVIIKRWENFTGEKAIKL